MAKRKKLSREEAIQLYNTYIPVVSEKIHDVKIAENGIVTLVIENKGFMNRLFQKIKLKPVFSEIHLDEKGSTIWKMIDGNTTLERMAETARAKFGEEEKETYDHLIRFFEIVESYDFIHWKKPEA